MHSNHDDEKINEEDYDPEDFEEMKERAMPVFDDEVVVPN